MATGDLSRILANDSKVDYIGNGNLNQNILSWNYLFSKIKIQTEAITRAPALILNSILHSFVSCFWKNLLWSNASCRQNWIPKRIEVPHRIEEIFLFVVSIRSIGKNLINLIGVIKHSFLYISFIRTKLITSSRFLVGNRRASRLAEDGLYDCNLRRSIHVRKV